MSQVLNSANDSSSESGHSFHHTWWIQMLVHWKQIYCYGFHLWQAKNLANNISLDQKLLLKMCFVVWWSRTPQWRILQSACTEENNPGSWWLDHSIQHSPATARCPGKFVKGHAAMSSKCVHWHPEQKVDTVVRWKACWYFWAIVLSCVRHHNLNLVFTSIQSCCCVKPLFYERVPKALYKFSRCQILRRWWRNWFDSFGCEVWTDPTPDCPKKHEWLLMVKFKNPWMFPLSCLKLEGEWGGSIALQGGPG